MDSKMRALWIVICCSCFPISAWAEAEVDWQPKSTRLFAVGLLEWQHPDIYSPFPAAQDNRSDAQLVKHFRQAGVPDEQITYLQDSAATKQAIQQALVEQLDASGEGELLVVYFAGHGYRKVDTGQTWFACYDANEKYSSGWNVRNIFKTIENHFNGDRVLFLVDCCHSGAVYDEAQTYRDSEIGYAVVTSCYSHNTSTGNWTFTDSLLTGLRGSPLVDLNGDEVIDLQELAHFNELELAFVEGQKSMYYASPDFPRKTKLVGVRNSVTPRVGQRLEVLDQGKWYRAKTIDEKGDLVKVHYIGYDNSWDEWVGPDRVRPFQPVQFSQGDKVQVQWSRDKQWYPARVLNAWYGLHLIRYDGYDESADEWIGPASIRLRTR